MNCAWKEFLTVLPPRLRKEIDVSYHDTLQEIRLRLGSPPELVTAAGICFLNNCTASDELTFVINAASRYSPWSSASLAKGYLTAQGGHRIGVCGEAVIENGTMKGFQCIRSLCIRIARDYEGISKSMGSISGSVLILGAPGWGKTTFLRDLIRTLSRTRHVSVVDERGELFPPGFFPGIHADILSNCPKSTGIEMVLRTMGPDYIAVDEITAQEDCDALLNAAHCGVELLATVHASSLQDLKNRCLYKKLLDAHVFTHCVIMSRDKSWKLERIRL